MRVAPWVLGGFVVLACGKSRHELGPVSPAAEAGASNVTGAGGSTTGPTGGDSNAAGSGGSAIPAGGAAGSTGGAAGAGSSQLCPGHDGYLTISGTLPGFGTDQTLRNGCGDSPVSDYAGPASYDGGPGEGTAGTITVVACNDDGSREVRAVFQFTRFRADAGGTAGLDSASMSYAVNGAFRTLTITNLTDTKTPVSNWLDVELGSDTGVGEVYEGSFDATDDTSSTPLSVHGAFSVCHVANLP